MKKSSNLGIRRKTTCGILSETDFLERRLYRIENCYSDHNSFYNEKLHFHDFYELSVIYEGQTYFLINGTLFPMKNRSVQLIRPTDYHQQKTKAGEHMRYYNFIFSTDFLSEPMRRELEEIRAPLYMDVEAKEWEYILVLLQKVLERFRKEPDTVVSRTFIHSSIEMLCVFILAKHEKISNSYDQNVIEAIRRAVVFVQKNYRKQIRLEDVAAVAALSSSYFSTIFHQTMGITFSEYLMDYRLGEAKKYLQIGELQVKQVAAVCGFSSYTYFVTAFKERFGCTPGKILKQTRACSKIGQDDNI